MHVGRGRSQTDGELGNQAPGFVSRLLRVGGVWSGADHLTAELPHLGNGANDSPARGGRPGTTVV